MSEKIYNLGVAYAWLVNLAAWVLAGVFVGCIGGLLLAFVVLSPSQFCGFLRAIAGGRGL